MILIKKATEQQLAEIRAAGLYKTERKILSPQSGEIRVAQGEVINLCANNYLGLANHPDVKQAAMDGLRDYGYGMASVRFICGTHQLHTRLEEALSTFLHTDDTILYSSCFDANGGLFETLLDERDAIISDALNHASLIDGIRLCKAARLRYAHADMTELEARLAESASNRVRMIVTDGVFSMDGDLAQAGPYRRIGRSVRCRGRRGRQSCHRSTGTEAGAAHLTTSASPNGST